jgi:prephenate dehydratase
MEEKLENASLKNSSPRIAIQGFEGSFHQLAANHFFGTTVEILPCHNFRDLVKLAENNQGCDGGIMAIENSIAGSILPNYNLLQASRLTVTGEIYIQINQQLLVNPGVKLEDIKEVHSHPMALQQCLEYLDKFPWKLVETEDTALSAKHLHQRKNKHAAAIAGTLAAELFDLEILASDIQTLKNNYTRFLVLQKVEKHHSIPDGNKASVNFHTDHSRGSLAKVLVQIADAGINLSKLQSFPIPGSQFKYSFHADMEFDNEDQFRHVLEIIQPLTEHIKIYGIYKRGKWIL